MTTAAPTIHKRRSNSPLRYRFFTLIILVSLLCDFRVIAQQKEAPKDQHVEAPIRPDTTFPIENGLLVLSSISDISAVLDPDEPKLLLVAVYSPSCTHCASLIANLEHAARHFQDYLQSIPDNDDSVYPAPLFAKFDATLEDPKLLKEKLDVTEFPTLLTITGTQSNALIQDWFGSIGTAEELYDTIRHYWYRWKDNHGSVLDISSIHDFMRIHGAGALQMVPPALDPNLSLEELSHLEWLLSDTRDSYILLVQCGHGEEQLDEEFQQAALIMAAKRNVLFLQSQECTGILSETKVKNGTIAAVFVDPPTDWNQWKDSIVQTSIYNNKKYDYLEQWIVQMTTPYVLWYDYKSVAPILFEKWRKIHAVLCVDVDDYTSTKRAMFQFYNACRHFSLAADQDFVCLIVPQTERLIFNTLGIDIWSPLDFEATQSGPIQPVLPTLVITDSRFPTTTRRFYLDAPDLLSSESSIHDFMDQFWNNQLTPFLKSSSRQARINDRGVQVLTGATFFNAVVGQDEKHTLLYLFIPTCAHCKRFSIVWNELSRLLRKMGWDSILQIAKMDVTTNERIHDFGLDTREAPNVYFIPKTTKTPIHYDVVDEFGDGPGRLSDSLDIVEWLLNVVAADTRDLLNPAQLLHLLQEEEKNDPVKSNGSNDTKANNTKEEEHSKESNV